uniref:Uncharacterized protein n=1 Tax=Trichobilharzia regenti TaxID=157069 RepID=A0AA85JBW4_TRIRE|nr:unnamed protein product [Trichobilharzia regenti]
MPTNSCVNCILGYKKKHFILRSLIIVSTQSHHQNRGSKCIGYNKNGINHRSLYYRCCCCCRQNTFSAEPMKHFSVMMI